MTMKDLSQQLQEQIKKRKPRTPKQYKHCLICSTPTKNRVFCSESCQYEGYRKIERDKGRRISRLCVFCGKKFEMHSSDRIIHPNKRYCSRECKDSHQKELYKGESNPAFGTKGPAHHRWNKTGRRIESTGYVKVRNEEGKWVNEHVLVVEKHLGRKLLTTKRGQQEQVHHIDGDKANNALENLFVCSQQEHGLIEGQLKRLSFELVKKGIIKFDPKRGYYEA